MGMFKSLFYSHKLNSTIIFYTFNPVIIINKNTFVVYGIEVWWLQFKWSLRAWSEYPGYSKPGMYWTVDDGPFILKNLESRN